MCCNDFCRQFSILAWKNATLKLRSLRSLFLELAVPTIILLILGAISKSSFRSTTEKYIPTQYSPSVDFSYFLQPIPCSSTLLFLCDKKKCKKPVCKQQHIAVSIASGADSTASFAASQFAIWGNQYATTLSNGTVGNDTFRVFSSEQSFLDTINDAQYSRTDTGVIYSTAIIFRKGYPNWDFIIRLNQSFNSSYRDQMPRTDSLDVDLTVKSSFDADNNQAYISSGYLALSDFVTTFILSVTCQATNTCGPNESLQVNALGVAEFPNGKHINAGFWTYIGFIFGLLMIISFCLPIANMIVYLVQEKETKMRETMYMMAMRSDALWLSWIFHFLCLFVPLALLLALAGQLLFEYSSFTYVFFYFMTFFLASISYCIFISTLFNKARSAAVVGCLLFFMGYIIYLGVDSETTITRGAVLAASIHPAAAFCFAALAFQQYEDSQIGITSFTWTTRGDTVPISFQDILNFLFIDIFVYAFLAWYTSNTFPSEYGTQKPWYFIFLPSYWASVFGFGSLTTPAAYSKVHSSGPDGDIEMAPSNAAVVEEVSPALKEQLATKSCISIRGLVKEFQTATGVKRAVDNLDLNIFSGEITALLGHNGAGKTTTIAMLTGLIPIDGGSAVIEGHDVSTQIGDIRKNLGVCPQHDILYPMLTVEEHFRLFASFKGVAPSLQQQEVDNMIQIVGLTEKRHAYSKSLSGGQKRKLSVGIAFIGGSRVVLLDEPTSGMDPYSRRFTWNLIRQQKKGRIVVLTTHFMDEADLLGDRVAIMGDGKLRCCGSSLYLKTKFGLGYSMTIEKKDANAFSSSQLSDIIFGRIPEARLLNDVGKEIVFQLPFNSSSLFQNLFEHFDENGEKLKIASYGVSVTTLEEVFITVQNGTETQAQAEAGRKALKDVEPGIPAKPSTPTGINVEQVGDKIQESNFGEYFVKHFIALFMKRMLYFLRDWKSWIFLYVVPFLFLLCGLLVMYFSTANNNQPLKTLDIRAYNPDIGDLYLPTPYSNSSTFCAQNFYQAAAVCSKASKQSNIMGSIPNALRYPIISNSTIRSIGDMSAFLYNGRAKYAAAQYGAVSFVADSFKNLNMTSLDRVAYVIHANYTATHAAAVFQSVVSNAILKSISPSSSIQVSIHPLPYTKEEQVVSSNFNVSIIALFILLAISVIPASFATHIVREREVKAKHQQIVSGVSYPVYWLSNWVWDFVSYIPTGVVFVILIVSFPNTNAFSGLHGQLAAFISLLVMFGVSCTSFTYLLSFLFKTPSGAQISCILSNFILGLILSIVGFALRLQRGLPIQKTFVDVLRYIFCLLPPFALGDGLYNLALLDFYSLLELPAGKSYDPFDWMITGLNLTFMAWTSVVYLLLCILVEYAIMNQDFQNSLTKIMNVKLPPEGTDVRDDDVRAEENRVKSLSDDEEKPSILIKNFKHLYPGGKYAVKGISLGINKGECFGLLGINGAGKSTTLSMLSGEFIPTTGEVHLAGINLLKEAQKCRRKIGFCPQFDSILELLSAREHLKLYARIKGIYESDIDRVVNAKIAEMGLTEYADRAAGTYSGGNKRKLSVAIAMIGEPSIVFLDEPSTGMDPVARRFMWRVISDIVTKREKCSLILTTHSMEECEALCTRIGIMVGGVLRCLGSGQHLRSKYGHGYQIEVGLVIITPEQIEERATQLLAAFGDAGVRSQYSDVTLPQIRQAFESLQMAGWEERLKSDTNMMLSQDGTIPLSSLSSWLLLEEKMDNLFRFFQTNFGPFQVRERQIAKVRVEISVFKEDGITMRPLSTLFGLIERNKEVLGIMDYSISQTSLEQIFNQFAAQQEEETGAVAGIIRN